MQTINQNISSIIVRIKPYLTRKNAELASLIFIILCTITLLTGRISTQQILTFENGKITYHGAVQANKINGQGKVTFENGDSYEGEFKNGIFHGQGTFTAQDGWTYIGEFKQGQADGQGTLTTQAKTVYKGTFKQGIFQYED